MGWTSYHADFYKNGKVDRKAECDKVYSFENDGQKSVVLKSSVVGSTYYAAVQYTNKDKNETTVYGAVCLTQIDNNDYFNFAYKDMTEFYGPCECKCPVSILKMLSDTDNEYAIEWRKRCREYHENKSKKTWLDKVEIGERIVFIQHDGKEVVLVKHAPAYQFKTWFWYDIGSGYYVKKNRVNVNNSKPYIENEAV